MRLTTPSRVEDALAKHRAGIPLDRLDIRALVLEIEVLREACKAAATLLDQGACGELNPTVARQAATQLRGLSR